MNGGSGPALIAPAVILALAPLGNGEGERTAGAKATNSSASEVPQMASSTVRLPIEGELPSLAGATAWINSPPLTPAGLRGKVVLIDIWTYTCINWRFT
jgi:hypothetical protein